MDPALLINAVTMLVGLVSMMLILCGAKVPRLVRKRKPKELPDPLKAALERKRRVHAELAEQWTEEYQRLLHLGGDPWRECGCLDCSRWRLYALEERLDRERRAEELERRKAEEDERRRKAEIVRAEEELILGWKRFTEQDGWKDAPGGVAALVGAMEAVASRLQREAECDEYTVRSYYGDEVMRVRRPR